MVRRSLFLWVLLAITGVGADAEVVGGQTALTASRRVTVDGVLVHYLDRPGASGPESPTLLLIHGWLGSSFDFSELIPRLPPAYRVIAVDLPGSGGSQKAGIRFVPGYFEALLSRFTQTIGIRRAVIVGHSMGGAIAVRLAVAEPELVERLILIDPYGMKGEAGALGFIRHSRLVVGVGFLLNSRLAIKVATKLMVFHNPRLVTDAYLESIAENCLSPEGRRAQTAVTAGVLGRAPVDGLLPRVEARTLIIWGSDDRVLAPSWAQRFAGLLPRSEVAFVADTGHMPQFEAPDKVARLIDQFAAAGRRP